VQKAKDSATLRPMKDAMSEPKSIFDLEPDEAHEARLDTEA
jgi:hypothetical protein